MEIINLNGVEYVKRSRIVDIEKERDVAQKDLEAIRQIVGSSLKDVSNVLSKTDDIKQKVELEEPKPRKINRRPNRKPNDLFEPLESSCRPFQIRYMNKEGKFFTANNKPLLVTIKHVLELQKFLHMKVTNYEVDELAKKFDLNYQIVHRLVWNYQQHIFDKYIAQWNKMTQPVVGMKNKPIQNNPEKRREMGIY